MIYVLATQGIGVEWGNSRGFAPERYKVISKPDHLRGFHPDPDQDRVIEVGPGPAEQEARGIRAALVRSEWAPEEIEWQPMVPAASPAPAKGGNLGGLKVVTDPRMPWDKWALVDPTLYEAASKCAADLAKLFLALQPPPHGLGVIKGTEGV